MRADIADTLRALAREHLEGRSSLESYRRLRAELLDGLLAPRAGPAPDVTQPRASTEREVMTQPRAARPLEPTTRPPLAAGPRSAAHAPRPVRRVGRAGMGQTAALAALGFLLAAAVVLLVWHDRTRARAARPAPVAAERTDPIRSLLQPLLEQPDWSDSRLRALNDALLRLGPARIAAERNAGWFDAVVDSVRSRLRQQQALAGAPLAPSTSPLAALARTLGIDLASPDTPAPARNGD